MTTTSTFINRSPKFTNLRHQTHITAVEIGLTSYCGTHDSTNS
jgi:hypothetical protein